MHADIIQENNLYRIHTK